MLRLAILNIGALPLRLFFFSSRRRHTRYWRDWSSDVCSSDLVEVRGSDGLQPRPRLEIARLELAASGSPVNGYAVGRPGQVHLSIEIEIARGWRDRKSVV